MNPVSVMFVWYYIRMVREKRSTYTVDVGKGGEIPGALQNVRSFRVELNAVPDLY
jgi:hypothetical protein